MGRGQPRKCAQKKFKPEAGPSSQPSPPVPSPLPPLPPTIFQPPKITLPSPPQQMAPLSPQQELFFKKHHRPYKIPLPRSQSAERAQPLGLARTPSLPSLSPVRLLFARAIPRPSFPQKEKPAPVLRKRNLQIPGTRTYQSDKYSGQRLCALRSWRQLGTSSSGRH